MPLFSEYESFDGLGLANLIKTGVIAPAELLEAAIERIELHNPRINAVITKMYDQARRTVKKNIPAGPFQGVPFLLKDLLADYKDAPLQFGSRFAEGWVSQKDSELVKRIKQAGLIVVGKTNTPEFGLSIVTEPELFGPTRNPYDVTRTAGGSSGGSAAAVAARMVPMAHGSDGAGSLRIPAAYCGLFALKPSRGRTPTGPEMMRFWQGMVVEHAVTRSVRDSAALLDVFSGPELGSPIALPKNNASYLDALSERCASLRIAVCRDPFFKTDVPVHPEYQTALKRAGQLCEELGHKLEFISPVINVDDVLHAYVIIIAAETASCLHLLADRMGQKINYTRLETATAVLCEVGESFTARDYAWANYILDMAGRDMEEFLTRYDVIMTPTMLTPPPLIGELQPDRVEKNILQLLRHVPYAPLLRKVTEQLASRYLSLTGFTSLFNISGQPAMSVPLYKDSLGLPIGIQFAGRVGDEKTLLQLAAQLEKAQSWDPMKIMQGSHKISCNHI